MIAAVVAVVIMGKKKTAAKATEEEKAEDTAPASQRSTNVDENDELDKQDE